MRGVTGERRGGGGKRRRLTWLWFLVLWGGHREGSWGRGRGRGVGGGGGGGPGQGAVKLRGHEDILLTLPSTLRGRQTETWHQSSTHVVSYTMVVLCFALMY